MYFTAFVLDAQRLTVSFPVAGVAAQYLFVSGTGIYVTGDPAALQTQLGADTTLTAVVSTTSVCGCRKC